MQNLTTTNSTMIGLCCLSPDNREYEHVHAAWNSRFDPLLLVDVADERGSWKGEEAVIQELIARNADSGGRLLGNQEMLVAVLLDLRAPIGHLMEELGALQKRLFRVFRKHCSGLIAFAHVGSIGQEDHLYESKRKNIHVLLETPLSRICLLALDHREKDGTRPWQTALLFGDILRRSDSVLNVFSDKHRLGFLEYAGYREAEYQHVVQRLERIRIRLGDSGKNRIRDAMNRQIGEITDRVRQKYVPSADCQPTHELLMSKSGFFSQLMRRRNRYCYDVAEESMLRALTETGSGLQHGILKEYELSGSEAIRLFHTFSDDVALVHLLDQSEVLQELSPGEETRIPDAIFPGGVSSKSDIQAYLDACVKAAINRGISNYANSIRSAYTALMDKNIFKTELEQIEDEQLALDEQLPLLPDLMAFCEQAVIQKKLLDSPFPESFSGTGRSQAICVCELNRADLLSALGNAEAVCKKDNMTAVTLFYQVCSLRTRRAAEQLPISMLRLNLFDIGIDQVADKQKG